MKIRIELNFVPKLILTRKEKTLRQLRIFTQITYFIVAGIYVMFNNFHFLFLCLKHSLA